MRGVTLGHSHASSTTESPAGRGNYSNESRERTADERERGRASKTLLKQEHCCFHPPACCWSASEWQRVWVCVGMWESRCFITAEINHMLCDLSVALATEPLVSEPICQDTARLWTSSCLRNRIVGLETEYRSLSCGISCLVLQSITPDLLITWIFSFEII